MQIVKAYGGNAVERNGAMSYLVLLGLLVFHFLGFSLLGKSSTEESVPECKVRLRKVGLDAIRLMMDVMTITMRYYDPFSLSLSDNISTLTRRHCCQRGLEEDPKGSCIHNDHPLFSRVNFLYHPISNIP